MDFNAWLGATNTALTDTNRAAAAWYRITQKPSSVAFKKRNGTVLTAQTVRLEYDSNATESQSAAGVAPIRKLTIFGVKGHDTITDTDVAEGYRFVLDGDEYTVIDAITTTGEIQAKAEAVG